MSIHDFFFLKMLACACTMMTGRPKRRQNASEMSMNGKLKSSKKTTPAGFVQKATSLSPTPKRIESRLRSQY